MPGKPKKTRNARKSKAYKHPIPSPNELIEFLDEAGKPLKIEKILTGFSLKGQRMRSLLSDRLYAMVARHRRTESTNRRALS